MSRKRTTKSLASRIQVDYLKRHLPIRYWKRVMILALSGAGALYLLTVTFAGKRDIHSPGPVSEAHHLFQGECSECHTGPGRPVSNDACLKCHADLVHHQAAINPPRCADCHVEHSGPSLIQTAGSWNCAACHVNLQRRDGKKSEYATGIRRIDKGHPEFSFLANPDTTAIKLNHKVHMKPDLEGAQGKKVTLQCGDCHRVSLEKDPLGIYRNGKITYETDCRDCHQLGFDLQFPQTVVPHKKPEEVGAFLESFYRTELQKNPTIFNERPARNLPGPSSLTMGKWLAPINGEEGYRWKMKAAEERLFGKVCLECHTWDYKGEAVREPPLPEVPGFKMRDHYFERGRFDHAAHRPIACSSCHVKAVASEKTSDLLVPGIKTCEGCHIRGGLARDACFECHKYHGPGLEKVMEGTLHVD